MSESPKNHYNPGTPVTRQLCIELGVKADPIEYRYSYQWLFRLMAEEGVHNLQIGSFFELYQLDDAYFVQLKESAQDHGIEIASMFTAHRELGGFLRGDPLWEKVARKNYERFIEIGALLGARYVGSNPGAILRDHPERKAQGIACYLKHMKELLHLAHDSGLEGLTIEPMSCLAEPPTLPGEIATMAQELADYHRANSATAGIGYCSDTSHGYANEAGVVVHSYQELFQATFPHMVEFHVKNTDAIYHSTFGFSEEERPAGIVDLDELRTLIYTHQETIPVNKLIAYLEIAGPKLGRDYSDVKLEESLRASLRYLSETLLKKPPSTSPTQRA